MFSNQKLMILDKFKLNGKTAIVTGASRGLGKAMAIGLAEAGADVALVASSSTDDAAKSIRALGRRVCQIQANLLDADAVPRIVDGTVRELGGIDILVNNAGTIRRAGVLEFNEKDWDEVIQINQKSLFFLSQAAAKQMVKQNRGGKIINVASMLSFQGGIRVAAYTASKSAVMGLTRILANELAAHNINVNAIAPGYMETDNTAALRADAKRNAEILARIPAGRWGSPEDLQGAAVFLASAASDYMQGYTVAVDGGWLSR
jgi:2-dehydro-3-deoxy-D-gluconate 5-dehydrogenase